MSWRDRSRMKRMRALFLSRYLPRSEVILCIWALVAFRGLSVLAVCMHAVWQVVETSLRCSAAAGRRAVVECAFSDTRYEVFLFF